MKTNDEYDFYLKETAEIRLFFSNKYSTQYSPDGILNPKKMFSETNSIHIVMLMKENRNYDIVSNKVKWSICDDSENTYELHKSSQNTSDTWAEIICGTINSVQTKKWDESGASGFAYINIKKKDEGRCRSKDKELNAFAISDSEYLRRQIISCRPDIIFCCGYRQINRLWKIFFPFKRFKRKEWQVSSYPFVYKVQYSYSLDGSERIAVAIDWKHPSLSKIVARCPQKVEEIKRELRGKIKQLQSNGII